MTLFGSKKVLLAAPLLGFLAAWAVPSAPAEAATAAPAAVANNCTYYSDASHTQVVGQFGYDCCNNRVSWGYKTQFVSCGGCFICFPPPR